MQVVLASNNQGKLTELQDILRNHFSNIRLQSEFDCKDVEETGLTFIENSILKARHCSKISGLPSIADDSGLCVPALDGKPGLYSARYAGENGNKASSAQNIQKLLAETQHLIEEQRKAFFYCVITFLNKYDDATPIIGIGRLDGYLSTEPKGDGGFGYDPIFIVPEYNKTMAELANLKNKISARALALNSLQQQLGFKA